jgi:hypothetical protein
MIHPAAISTGAAADGTTPHHGTPRTIHHRSWWCGTTPPPGWPPSSARASCVTAPCPAPRYECARPVGGLGYGRSGRGGLRLTAVRCGGASAKARWCPCHGISRATHRQRHGGCELRAPCPFDRRGAG